MTPEQLANLRALAEAATPGPWTPGVPHEQDPRKVYWSDAGDLKLVANASQFRGFADARYIAAVSPDVVQGLLDDRDRLAARVLELEAPGECQSLHRLRAEVQVQSDRAEQAVAERDELAAEVAAYQGRPEGALPGWAWSADDRMWVREVRDLATGALRILMAGLDGTWGTAAHGTAPTPRAAMRAAEAAARSRGWM